MLGSAVVRSAQGQGSQNDWSSLRGCLDAVIFTEPSSLKEGLYIGSACENS